MPQPQGNPQVSGCHARTHASSGRPAAAPFCTIIACPCLGFTATVTPPLRLRSIGVRTCAATARPLSPEGRGPALQIHEPAGALFLLRRIDLAQHSLARCGRHGPAGRCFLCLRFLGFPIAAFLFLGHDDILCKRLMEPAGDTRHSTRLKPQTALRTSSDTVPLYRLRYQALLLPCRRRTMAPRPSGAGPPTLQPGNFSTPTALLDRQSNGLRTRVRTMPGGVVPGTGLGEAVDRQSFDSPRTPAGSTHRLVLNLTRPAAPSARIPKDHSMSLSLSTIVLVLLVLLLLGALPSWPHSRSWGYAPSGLIGTALVVVLVLVLIGRV
jgi:Protein of unknown function (DUF3309)